MAKTDKTINAADISGHETESHRWLTSSLLEPTTPINKESVIEILINYKNYPISDLYRYLWLWDHIFDGRKKLKIRTMDSFSNDEFLLIIRLFLLYLLSPDYGFVKPPNMEEFLERIIMIDKKEPNNE